MSLPYLVSGWKVARSYVETGMAPILRLERNINHGQEINQ